MSEKAWKSKPGVRSGSRRTLSGFCLDGHHEGDRPRGYRDQPMKTCHLIDTCDCECHDAIDEMFEAAGLPRQVVDNPEFHADRGVFHVPARLTPEGRAKEAISAVESRKPSEVIATREFAPNQLGGRAKGQLEDQVLVVCSAFQRGEFEVDRLTPAEIARRINPDKPPSTGAIGAVFDRWVRIGFALCPKGPVRFESFTVEGMTEGLEALKEKYKRSKG